MAEAATGHGNGPQVCPYSSNHAALSTCDNMSFWETILLPDLLFVTLLVILLLDLP
jgi:hypothetical protein